MTSQKKIIGVGALKKNVARLRKQGRTIAFTNGCFDLMHYGHVSYLETAKKNNRVLIVGLNSDRSVKKIKDPSRPIISQKGRAALVAALGCVDYVTLFDEATPAKLIAAVQPDVLIKGADWKGKEIAGSSVVKARGGKVEFIRYIAGFSTTGLIQTIIKKCAR